MRAFFGYPIGFDGAVVPILSLKGLLYYILASGVIVYNIVMCIPAFICLQISVDKWDLKSFKISDILLFFYILFSVFSIFSLLFL